MDEKRSRSSGSRRRRRAAAVGVVNEAGHRGLDHPDLRTIIVMEPPSGVKSWLQLAARARRRQSGTVAVQRAALFAVAGIIVDDAKKLAEFTDLVRLFESVRFCWRSVSDVLETPRAAARGAGPGLLPGLLRGARGARRACPPLVDNACVTARQFGGSDRSSASMTHFTVRVLLRIQLAAAGGLYDDAMPKFAACSATPTALRPHLREPGAKDYGRVFMPFERDGQRVEIEFRPVETLSKLMRGVPDLARRASSRWISATGVKLEAIATLDKLMRHSIDKVTPGHKEAAEIKVLPASQHNELTTDGAARIFMDLLPIQTPASFGISDGVDRGKKQIDTLKDRAAARRVAGAAKVQLAVDAKSKGIAAANKAKEAKKRKSPVPAAALTPVPVPVLVQSDAVSPTIGGRLTRQWTRSSPPGAARADALDDGDAFDDGDPGDAFDRRDRRDPGGDGDDGDPATTATAATAARLELDAGRAGRRGRGLVMTCSDGLTVSRCESALAKLRDAVIDGAGSKEEANIVLKQLSLFLTCNVVEHDRLHAVFHLTHLTLKHGFEHLGRAVARARGLTGVTTSSAEAGQNVRKKVHHERIQCLAAVKELVSAMLRDDAFRSRVDALPVEGGTIKQADFVALLVAFLTSGDGGSEFECVRDHALLAMNLHAFKTSLQWRHWLFANVAETISTPAMLANNKPNYGILFLELPFLSRMRSLAQSLGFWRSAMTVATRGVEAARRRTAGSRARRPATAKMKAATAVAGLGAAVLHGYHRSLELRRERRRDFGGVAVKKEVAAVAALFRGARSCERRPDRAPCSRTLR
ncbi:hypothetical protein JL722_10551 [Aureococcus anophagefferens]|nr:hypothetical protein JL722_10551 [Aureococcus anophagefferens]